MAFTGQTEVPHRWKNGRVAKQKGSGEVVYEKKAHEETAPNMEFIRKKKLNLDSHPVHWFDAFIPLKSKKEGSLSMEQFVTWTNM